MYTARDETEDAMDQAYTICMAIGIGLPLLSLVLGQLFDFFDGLFEGFDFDFEIGDTNLSWLPMSMQSICGGLLIFGTLGKLLFHGGNMLFANIAAGAAGYLAALLIQYLINRLKKIEHRPPTRDELALCEAKVTHTIVENGFGAVSIKTESGTVSYPAKSLKPEERILQGCFVDIIKFEKNVAVVQPAKQQSSVSELFG